MKRTNSWKNLQKTFASTPETVPKRAKVSRRPKVNRNHFIRSLDDSNDFQIEDSDEENTQSTTTPLRTPLHRNSYRRLAKPLLINTSLNTTLNSSISNNSIAVNSESDESLPAEPELRDVSECQPTRTCKARSKSLLFLSTTTKNQQHSQNTDTSQDVSAKKKPSQMEKTPKRNTTIAITDCAANKSRVDNLDSTIIESDSSSDSPQKCSSIVNKRNTFSSQIIFSENSAIETPVIESESTQFSLKFDTPIVQVPVRRIRSRKHIKGGLVEHLNKAVNSTKSEYSFWMNERTSDLIPAAFKMRIDKMEHSYGRILLHCFIVDQCNESNLVYILCVDPAFKKLPMLQIGHIIEVELDCRGYSTAKNTRFYPQVSKILI